MPFLKNKLGFSLIEALVVVSITVTLTSVLVVHSRSSEKQIIFFRDQSLVVSSILRAKAFSIETFQPELQPGLPLPTSADRVCGWGVFFDKAINPGGPSQIIVFSDVAPGDGASDCASANKRYAQGPGNNEKFETITLHPAIIIACLGINSGVNQPCSGNASKLDVVFVPPDPLVFFDGGNTQAEAVIVIQINDPAQPRTSTIRISNAGQVSVN